MTQEDIDKLRQYLIKKDPLTVKEASLYRILTRDDNIDRVNSILVDHPDLRTLAWEIVEVL